LPEAKYARKITANRAASSLTGFVHNHFNQERHLVTQQVYKQRRTAALAEWNGLAA